MQKVKLKLFEEIIVLKNLICYFFSLSNELA